MSENVEIKQASMEDLKDLAEIFNHYRMFYGQDSDVEGAELFLFDRFVNRESIMFIARDIVKKQIIGFTQLYPSFSSISMKRSIILNDLYVIESYRKQGIAQLLLDEAKKYMIWIKAKGLELSTALDNTQAKRLYEKNGYIKDDEYAHYFLANECM
ncbi:MAG: N-acetyltransferase family protein [Candidatus Pristimantibacillus sp.]